MGEWKVEHLAGGEWLPEPVPLPPPSNVPQVVIERGIGGGMTERRASSPHLRPMTRNRLIATGALLVAANLGVIVAAVVVLMVRS